MKKTILILLVAILLFGFITDLVVGSTPDDFPRPRWNDNWDKILKERQPAPFIQWIGVISISLNIILLLMLLFLYLQSFRKTKSYFMIALSFFIGVLLVQKIMFFFFPLVTQVFETLALVILLMLSFE